VDKGIEKYLYTLQQRGYKSTNQREEILNILLDNKNEHLSCEDVHKIISMNDKEVGIATVYRTLQLFEKLGIVYKINFDDGVARYELNTETENHHHHHLICTECGKVTEVKLDLLESLEKEIEIEEDFIISDHDVKFYGICKECKDNYQKKWE